MKRTLSTSRIEIWQADYINMPEARDEEKDKKAIILQCEPSNRKDEYIVEVVGQDLYEATVFNSMNQHDERVEVYKKIDEDLLVDLFFKNWECGEYTINKDFKVVKCEDPEKGLICKECLFKRNNVLCDDLGSVIRFLQSEYKE